jgi:teichuronic acid biosynthesis glycosyltransferase TuaG
MARIAQEDSLVSVILPVYNASAFLRRTLESVFTQTYSQWEILAVLDPGTTDDSWEILEELGRLEPRLRIFKSNGYGVAAARNLGLRQSRGRWLAFLDADDFWLPSKLERQLAWMREREASFSATGFRRIDETGRRIGRLIGVPRRISHSRLLKQNSLCVSSVMLDRRRVGPVSFEDIGCEDYALWLSLTQRGLEGFGIPEDLVRYRVVSGSRGSSKWKTAKESWVLLRRNSKLVPAVFKFTGFLARGAIKHSKF